MSKEVGFEMIKIENQTEIRPNNVETSSELHENNPSMNEENNYDFGIFDACANRTAPLHDK